MKGGGGEYPMTVAVRIRPPTETEAAAKEATIAHRVNPQMIVLCDPLDDVDDVLRTNRSREKRYIFDHVFDAASGQGQVYQLSAKSLVEGVVNGYNGTVFAYGATGSGKTFTMLGTASDPGVYVRALDDIFDLCNANAQDENQCHVSISYLEIYNEMLRDLLSPAAGYLEMREDPRGAVQVAGLSEVTTSSTAEIMELLQAGNQERTQEPTKANSTSSRSHAVLQVTVKQRVNTAEAKAAVATAASTTTAAGALPPPPEQAGAQLRVGRLYLVDLAGSERAANTQNRGKRMVEGAHINRSLLALGNCINALCEMKGGTGYKYVNYRDSKLTRLLKESLGGNCRTVMIAHVSPAASNFEESRNTLIYAERAKKIKNKVRRNIADISFHVSQYAAVIHEMRDEIQRLRAKLASSASPSPAMPSHHAPQLAPARTSADIKTVHSEVVGGPQVMSNHNFLHLKEQLMTNLRDQVELRRELMALDNVLTEVNEETVRQQLTVAQWELSKTAAAFDHAREDKHSATRQHDTIGEEDDGYETSELPKQLELAGLSTDDVEPEEVTAARNELIILTAEKRNAERKKKTVMGDLRKAKHRASELEESLPRQVNSDEQKEIVALLLRANEMEVSNAEMQALLHLQQNDLARKSAAIAYFTDYNALADRIIVKQHELILVHGTPVTRELSALYEAYCTLDRPPVTNNISQVRLSHRREQSTTRSTASSHLPSIEAKVSQEENVSDATESGSEVLVPSSNIRQRAGQDAKPQHQQTSSATGGGRGGGGGGGRATSLDENWQREAASVSRQQMLAFLKSNPKNSIGHSAVDAANRLFVPSPRLPPLTDEELLRPPVPESARERTSGQRQNVRQPAQPPSAITSASRSPRAESHTLFRGSVLSRPVVAIVTVAPAIGSRHASASEARDCVPPLRSTIAVPSGVRREAVEQTRRSANSEADDNAAGDDESDLDTPRSLALTTATPSGSAAALAYDEEFDPFSPESSGGGAALRQQVEQHPPPMLQRSSRAAAAAKARKRMLPRRSTATAADDDAAAAAGESESEYGDAEVGAVTTDAHRMAPSANIRSPEAETERRRASALQALKRTARKRSLQRLLSNGVAEQDLASRPAGVAAAVASRTVAAAAAAAAAVTALSAAGTRSRLPRYVVNNKRFSAAGARRTLDGAGGSASYHGRLTPSAKLTRAKVGPRQGKEKTSAVVDREAGKSHKQEDAAARSTEEGLISETAGGSVGGSKPSIPPFRDADIRISGLGLK